ncbi:hypothetical protein SAMN04488168_13646 [Bacillus sp. 491mf]|nr:hypothetical protein [Bacillus sp. 491mf]SFD39080.1 hypothetical protein SAMN04488168_13646 [Bacillus sp. 491mf]
MEIEDTIEESYINLKHFTNKALFKKLFGNVEEDRDISIDEIKASEENS